MDAVEYVKNNQVVVGAVAGALVLLIAVLGFSGPGTTPEADNTTNNPVNPADQNNQQQDTKEDSDTQRQDKSRFSSTKKNYSVMEILGVGEKVAVRASTNGDEIIDLNGSIVAKSGIIPELGTANGDLYYVLNENGSKYVFKDGEKVSEGYSSIRSISEVGGKLTLTVQKELLPAYIVRDGEKIGKKYYEAEFPAWVNGKLAYKAVETGQNFIVHGGEEQEKFDEVGRPIEAEGKLTYRALDGNTEFVKHGKERVATGYSSISGVYESKGKLTYVANDEGSLKLIRDGKNILPENSQLLPDTITKVGEKLAYIVRTNGDEKLIYDGEEVGEEYNIQASNGLITDINGKLAFAAKKNNQWHIVKEN